MRISFEYRPQRPAQTAAFARYASSVAFLSLGWLAGCELNTSPTYRTGHRANAAQDVKTDSLVDSGIGSIDFDAATVDTALGQDDFLPDAPDAGDAGGFAGSGSVFDAIPAIDEEPPPPCEAVVNGADGLQFLNDVCDVKRYPADHDRDRTCPSAASSSTVVLEDGRSVTYAPSSADVAFDDESLNGLVPDAMRITVILIRRVAGVPHYRYLSNGTHSIAYQPWSTSKFLAVANAAANLRKASAAQVGLTANIDGYPLGDLITSVCNYDNDPYSSNSLGAYFHDIGGRKKANELIHKRWLQRPEYETFGGNYGEQAPSLGYTFVEPDGDAVTIELEKPHHAIDNYLSSFTLAEALKRLVLHREEPAQRLPDIEWADIRVLLYGAEASHGYGLWGGMNQDDAVYLQSAHDIDYIEARSHGQWSIFSKLGSGEGGELLNVGYACFPVLDDQGEPMPDWGREFVIAAQLPEGGDSWAERDRILAKAYRAIVKAILHNRL